MSLNEVNSDNAALVAINHQATVLSLTADAELHLPKPLYDTLLANNLLDGQFHHYTCERNGKATKVDVCIDQFPATETFQASVGVTIAFSSGEGDNEEMDEFQEIFNNKSWYASLTYWKIGTEDGESRNGNHEAFSESHLNTAACEEMTPGIIQSVFQQLKEGNVIQNIPEPAANLQHQI